VLAVFGFKYLPDYPGKGTSWLSEEVCNRLAILPIEKLVDGSRFNGSCRSTRWLSDDWREKENLPLKQEPSFQKQL
jgi:hypothetical protein